MKYLLASVLTLEIAVALLISIKLRLCRTRISTLEVFVFTHFPLIALGVLSCTWFYSMVTVDDAWIFAAYLPVVLVFVLVGAGVALKFVPRQETIRKIELSQNDTRLLQTCLTCLGLTMIGFWAMTYDQRGFSELLSMNRISRWTSSMDAVSFKQLNQLLIIPVIVLFTTLFVKGGGYRKLRITLFSMAVIAFGFSCLIALSRGRIFQAVLAMLVISWYLGGSKIRKAVVISSIMLLLVFAPLSVALWEYRESIDIIDAIDSLASFDWMHRILEDPTFECNDICMAVLDHYKDSHMWRYTDGVTPLALFFIPRRIWTEKPIVFGPLVWRDVLGGGGEVIGVGPTFIGEAYSIAGVLGLVICSFVLGVLLVLYEHLVHKYLNPWEAIAMVAVVLMPAATIVRGDFHSAFIMRFVVYPVAYFGVFMAVKLLLHVLHRNDDESTDEPEFQNQFHR